MRIACTIVFCSVVALLFGQEVYTLEQMGDELPAGFELEFEFESPASRQEALEQLLKQLVESGYITASIDSVTEQGETLAAYVYVGSQFSWVQLTPGNASEVMLSAIGFRDKIYRNTGFEPGAVYKLFNKILTYYENNGYPFANVKLDSVVLDYNGVMAQLNVQPNTFIQIDSVIIKGDATVSSRFIEQYIGINSGDPYSEEKLQGINRKLRSVPFISVVKLSQVAFKETGATVYLYLNKRKASDINGIIGIQPDNETGAITVTGDAKLGLKNAFKQGETLLFEWRQLQTKTQDLKVFVNFPFVFQTPFGTDLGLKLYKRDTSFIEVTRDLGLQYHLSGENYVRAFFNWYSSDLLNTNNISPTILPDYADVSSASYGLGFKISTLDYLYNPRSGLITEINASTGTKKITKNPDLDESLYDDIELKSAQYKIQGYVQYFVPIFRSSAIMVGVQGASLLNDNMFQNELFRVGGLKDLRGFDQESLFASSFVISTIEYRLLFEENSNVHLFADFAWYESNTISGFSTDTPYGFGAGISFETGAGIFSLNYALGKQLDNPILLKAGKIHFGFVSLF